MSPGLPYGTSVRNQHVWYLQSAKLFTGSFLDFDEQTNHFNTGNIKNIICPEEHNNIIIVMFLIDDRLTLLS